MGGGSAARGPSAVVGGGRSRRGAPPPPGSVGAAALAAAAAFGVAAGGSAAEKASSSAAASVVVRERCSSTRRQNASMSEARLTSRRGASGSEAGRSSTSANGRNGARGRVASVAPATAEASRDGRPNRISTKSAGLADRTPAPHPVLAPAAAPPCPPARTWMGAACRPPAASSPSRASMAALASVTSGESGPHGRITVRVGIWAAASARRAQPADQTACACASDPLLAAAGPADECRAGCEASAAAGGRRPGHGSHMERMSASKAVLGSRGGPCGAGADGLLRGRDGSARWGWNAEHAAAADRHGGGASVVAASQSPRRTAPREATSAAKCPSRAGAARKQQRSSSDGWGVPAGEKGGDTVGGQRVGVRGERVGAAPGPSFQVTSRFGESVLSFEPADAATGEVGGDCAK
mmetsp:Transcript_25417/g.82165  ORF Transcript_25417/g.82165 Transcript_25417/m.82165 type:complete len:411 (-) Transcript_25417:3288-4520(-)